MMNTFIGQSEMVFFRFFQRLVILGADQKDLNYSVCLRVDCHYKYFFCLSMTGFSFVSRRCLFTCLRWASCSGRF